MIPSSDTTAAHRRIYGDLVALIAAGRWDADGRLPTEHELVEQYGVSRSTVSRAMQQLARDGVVERRRGAGTFVAGKPPGAAAGDVVCLFVPFLSATTPLPHVESQMRHFVVEGAARAGLVPRLQPLAGDDGAPIEERFLLAVHQVIGSGARAVLYYPAELPAEISSLNQRVVERLEGADLEVLLVDRDVVQPPERSHYVRIGFDNLRGSARLAAHMIGQGCRRLAFVGLAAESSSALERAEGFRIGIEECGDPGVAHRIWRVDHPTPEIVEQIMREFKPDGIVCKSDLFAAEVARCLQTQRVEVGRDVLLAGFDDSPIASLLQVPLTTVRLNARAFAEAAIHCVGARLSGTLPQCVQVLIDCELVVRASTGGTP